MLAPDLGDLRLGDERPEGRGQPGVDRDDDLASSPSWRRCRRRGAARRRRRRPERTPADRDRDRSRAPEWRWPCSRWRCRRPPARLQAVEPEALAQRVELRFGLRLAELDRAAEEVVRVEPPQREIGVGDGDLLAAGVVADRAGIGPGALRADAEETALVDPGDRAAARADGGRDRSSAWRRAAPTRSRSWSSGRSCRRG